MTPQNGQTARMRNGRIRCPVLLCAFNISPTSRGSRRQFEFCLINLFDEFQQPSIPYFTKDVDYRKIQDICSSLNNDIESMDRARLAECGRLIRNHLIPRGVTDYFRSLEEEYSLQILLVTNDISVPWEILHDDTDFWSLKYSVGRIYGISGHDHLRFRSLGRPRKTAQPPLLLVSDPEENLEYARKEGMALSKKLAKQFRVKALSGRTDATDLALAIGSDGYDIIHFAGHADMERGGALRAFRSRLESHDIAGYSLCRRPVVFANACSTGAKRYYGANSKNLAEAFIEAGASAFIGTLWQTTDKLSAEFAAEFYKHLRNGVPIGDSLRLAKVALAKKAGPLDIDWAAFSLFGDPEGRLFLGTSQEDMIPRRVQLVMSNKPGTLGKILMEMSNLGIDIIRGRSITFDNQSAAGYIAEIEMPASIDEDKLAQRMKKGKVRDLLYEINLL